YGARHEALTVIVVEDLLHLETEAGGGGVHEFEGPHRVPEAEPARKIDILRARDFLLDQPERLDHERMQKAVHCEAGDVLDADRRLSDVTGERRHGFHRLRRGLKRRDDLDQLHARDRREIMRAHEAWPARLAHMR